MKFAIKQQPGTYTFYAVLATVADETDDTVQCYVEAHTVREAIENFRADTFYGERNC